MFNIGKYLNSGLPTDLLTNCQFFLIFENIKIIYAQMFITHVAGGQGVKQALVQRKVELAALRLHRRPRDVWVMK